MGRYIQDRYKNWKAETLSRFAQLKANEEELNRIFIDIYGLQDELSPEVADRDVTVYRIIDEPDAEERKMRYVLSKKDAIITLISYAVGCMLGRYSLDVEGLAFAGGGFSEQWTVISGQYYRKEVVEKYGCKALSGLGGMAKGDGLGGGGLQAGEAAAQRGTVWTDKPDAQSGSLHSLQHRGGTGEELNQGICSVSGNRPGQQGGATNAAAAMRAPGISDPGTNEDSTCPYRRIGKDGVCIEAGADHCPLTTDHFPSDADGILPITDEEYFTDDIVTRFVDWVRVAYGADTLEENLRFVADALGGSGTPRDVIRSYFLKDFYKDHVKAYKKRPIYWLFDSGKQDSFKALIYLHRYQPDTIARLRTDYVHELQSRYRTAVSSLESRIASATTAERVKLSRQLSKITAQAEELRLYEEKIHHLADQMIAIDLDDGVKHNYAIFGDVFTKI